MADGPNKPALARSVIGGRHVCVVDRPAHVGKPREGGDQPQAQIEVIREGNLVRAVDITCACGERIRVRFDYE